MRVGPTKFWWDLRDWQSRLRRVGPELVNNVAREGLPITSAFSGAWHWTCTELKWLRSRATGVGARHARTSELPQIQDTTPYQSVHLL
jgi:hypothetical protein